MKARKFLAFVAAAGMLFAGGGCTPNEEGDGATADPLTYELNPTSMVALSSEETVETVQLTTNGRWNVTIPEDHSDIVVTPLSGKGNATLTVTVPAHEDRIVALTVNFSKKTTVPGLGTTIEENENLTFNISQNATGTAVTPIAELVADQSATIQGVLSAVGSKASIVTDATGSVVLYGNPDDNYVVGTKVTITGTPAHYKGYSTNALQIDKSESTVEVVSAGNTVDYNPQVLTATDVDALVGADAVCTEVQFEGTVVIGQYANVSIEGASKQASLYYVTVADYEIYDGIKVVVKGYVTGTYNYLNVLPYSVETTEKIIYCKDITSVPAAGVENETVTIQTLNITGEVSAEADGQIVTAASVSGNVLTYTVAANDGDVRDGEITLSADGVEKKVKVSQLGSLPEAYPYAESFATSQGAFSIKNVSLAEGITYVWSYDSSNKYMKGSAYNGAAYAAESWLVSPKIDMTGATAPVLTFTHLVNMLNAGTPAEYFTVNVKEVTATEWTALEIPQHGKNDGWNWVESGDIDLSAYVGKTIQIGFKYTSTAEAAGTWEVKNVKVAEKGSTDVPVVPGDYNFISDAPFVDSTQNYTADGTANGSKMSGFKIGTGSLSGYFASQPVAVEGDVTLEFYAVAWKGKSATLYVRKQGSTDLLGQFTLKANDGATNSSPYTMTVTDEDYYSVEVSGVTANTVFEFATDASFSKVNNSSSGRAIVVGAHIVGGTPSTPTTPETPETPEQPEGGETPSTPAEGKFVEVTAAPADWSGKYLIVFGNNAHGAVSGKDLISTSVVTISNGEIVATSELLNNAAVTVAALDSNYSILLPSGSYLSNAKNSCATSASAYAWTFDYTESGVKMYNSVPIENVTYILYNNSNNYFRCYVDKNGQAGYTLPKLYKYVAE